MVEKNWAKAHAGIAAGDRLEKNVTATGDGSEPDYHQQTAGSLAGLNELLDQVQSAPLGKLAGIYKQMLDENGGTIPKKAHFDISRLGGTLAHTVLYDVSDPARVEFRVVGEQMKNHFKVNPVGRSYLEFVPEARRSLAHRAFRLCAEMPCAMLSRTRQFFGNGLGTNCEALGVPLMGPGEGPATHLLFVDYPVSDGSYEYFHRTEFRFSHMRERIFVDLGKGTPKDFVDLVVRD